MQVFTREKIMSAFARTEVILLTACLSSCIALASAGRNSPHVGEAPPPLAISDVVQGPAIGEITWHKLKGKVVVLEFWNTRCAPCIQAIPHLNELADEFRLRANRFTDRLGR